MVNVRVAYQSSDLFWVENESELKGPYASLYEKYLQFVTSKANVSFVEYEFIYGHRCFFNDTCQGILNDLQKGLIDLSMTRFNYNSLGVIAPNLTTIVQEEAYCYSVYKQNVTEVHSGATFFGFLAQFDFDVWLPFTILITLFSLIFFIISILQSKQSIAKVIWHHCEYLLYQNFEPFESLHRKWFYIIYIVILLVVSKIMSSTLQTGLAIHKSYIKLESYQDIMESGYLYIILGSVCASMTKNSIDPFAVQMIQRYEEQEKPIGMENLNIDRELHPNPFVNSYLLSSSDSLVTLMESAVFDIIKRAGCTFAIEQEMKAPLIEKRISTMFYGYLISKRSLPRVQKIIFDGYYALFETGVLSSPEMSQSLLSYWKLDESPSCMDKDESPREESETIPLNFTFFHYPFVIFIIQMTIAIIFFLFGLKFGF